jgi:hypothetical protein
VSCFRRFLRSALSLCLCCRVCSFWRFVKVDRPLGIRTPNVCIRGRRARPVNVTGTLRLKRTTSEVRAAVVGVHGSRRGHDLRRQNGGLRL